MTTYVIDVYYKLNKTTKVNDMDDMDDLLNTHAKKYGGILTSSDVGPYGCCCFFPTLWRINIFFIPKENIHEFRDKMPKNFHIDKCFLL